MTDRILVDGHPHRPARWRAIAARLGLGRPRRQPGWSRRFPARFDGSVIIIGAGAAGLTAGYALEHYGIDCTILEAADRIGGRIRRHPGLADFPLDLGAEWLHATPTLLAELLDEPAPDGIIEMIAYRPQTFRTYSDGRLRAHDWLRFVYREYKFARTTWFDVFDRFVAPVVADRVRLEQPVTAIDHSGPQVKVTTADGEILTADRVLLTVPLTVLQRGGIRFTPSLDDRRRAALDGVEFSPGLKVFSRFSERFYPDITAVTPLRRIFDESNLAFYDAAFGKGSADHVLGLFSVGDFAAEYAGRDPDEIVQAKLQRLDAIFDGRASQAHVESVVQDWTAEPHIGGGYTWDFAEGHPAFLDVMAPPLDGRVFFAGEAFAPPDARATVHGAMLSAYAAVERLLAG